MHDRLLGCIADVNGSVVDPGGSVGNGSETPIGDMNCFKVCGWNGAVNGLAAFGANDAIAVITLHPC